MKYILLIYSAEDAWQEDELETARDRSVQVCHELNDQGCYLSAAPLDASSTARCVTVRKDQTMVTDGPFMETKEHLVGYFLIDVANIDEAIKVAEKVPGTTRGTTEIRPIIELPGLPECSGG